MKIVPAINIDDFLANSEKNIIMIHFNQEIFNQQIEDLDFNYFRGKWLFCEQTKIEPNFEMKGELLYTEKFYSKGKVFELEKYYEKVLELESKFRNLYPDLKSPDIIISSNNFLDGSSCLIYDKLTDHYTMFLSLSDLDSLDKFSFTVGHELGHIAYKCHKNELESPILKKRYLSLFPWEMTLIWGINFYIGLAMIMDKQVNISLHILGIFITLFWSWYFLMSLVSFKRLINYNMEFFCDRFALYLDPTIEVKNLDAVFNLAISTYTHPNERLRLSELRNFNDQEMFSKNPILNNKSYYRTPNLYEISYCSNLIADNLKFQTQVILSDLKYKFNKLFNKKDS